MYPEELKYSKEHEWVKVDGGKVRIGVTEYAQNMLGDVVFVELPEEGDQIEIGDAFGVIESVKAVSDIYAPISGEVVAINEGLLDSPEKINEAPYEEGWIIEVELSDESQLDELMTAAEYQEFTKKEE
ncbi:glycine cleavage system H protein [Desulfitispora alkaliphila]|uniref:glycine cleavage system protein GcvH n=1 Tax=Desulfitispora alkaliphila TaxID=622674 RepID=UPI003D1DCEFB